MPSYKSLYSPGMNPPLPAATICNLLGLSLEVAAAALSFKPATREVRETDFAEDTTAAAWRDEAKQASIVQLVATRSPTLQLEKCFVSLSFVRQLETGEVPRCGGNPEKDEVTENPRWGEDA